MLPRPIQVAFALFLSVLVVGTGGFMWIEGWRLLDALWMVVITLTTIGYGEIHPMSDRGRWFAIGVIMAGVSVGTYAMGALTQMIVEGQLQALVRRRRLMRQVKALRDHYIVVGFGRLGQAIADELHSSGKRICVIEHSAEKVAAAEALARFPVVQGDGTHDDVLRQAGIERAKGIAIAVDSSAQAVYVTLSARELNPGLNIVTRVDDGTESVKARRAGATSVVSPHTMGGWRMAHELIRPHATSFLELLTLSSYEDAQLEELLLAPGNKCLGSTLGRLHVAERTGALVVAIRRADGSIAPAPRGNEVLREGDVLLAIGTPDAIRRFTEMFTGTDRPDA